MTSPIFADFERMEQAAKKTPCGPDFNQIVRILADKYCIPANDVRTIIIENTIQGP
ncbi:MAG: hypothetical protein R3235_09940 [Altererythrobacter ishigakiensis]|nr:hypothetical protein [Altererythrobacter ishigakiensis]